MTTNPASKYENRPLKRSLGGMLIFLLGLSTCIEIQVGGRLFLIEALLMVALPFLFWVRRKESPSRTALMLLLFGVLWLIGQAVTDIVLESPSQDWTRGISKIIFLLTSFVAMHLLLGKNRRWWLLFSCGLGLGFLIMVLLQGQDLSGSGGWKFGGGFGIALAATALSVLLTRSKTPLAPILVLSAFGTYSMVLGARSLAGIAIAGAGVLLLQRVTGRVLGASGFRPVVLSFLLLVSGYGIITSYEFLAGNGILGDEMQTKYENQLKRGSGNFLKGGRTESEVSLLAIGDSPILGHGSWAKSSHYAAIARQKSIEAGIVRAPTDDVNLIPSHSYLFGAWVEAGILGGLFWGLVTYFCIHTLIARMQPKEVMAPIASFALVALAWDIPFSPFGSHGRISVAFTMALICLLRAPTERLLGREEPSKSQPRLSVP